MLDRAVRCAGSRTLTVKVALTPGSSQQGKARLASSASNCVLAMTFFLPLASTYSDL
ncbi:hypothetical protein B484DRAFT_443501, partial [Ochromonadaceae sp. CCMP2298]